MKPANVRIENRRKYAYSIEDASIESEFMQRGWKLVYTRRSNNLQMTRVEMHIHTWPFSNPKKRHIERALGRARKSCKRTANRKDNVNVEKERLRTLGKEVFDKELNQNDRV